MCELKKAIWREYNAEIQEALSSSEKVRNIPIPTTEKERNYLKRMNLPDARTYFRVRCKITNNIKGNRSSQFRNDMTCRYCPSGEIETQEHMTECAFTSDIRSRLNLNKEEDTIVFWRKLNSKLYKVYNDTSTKEENLRKIGIYIHDNTQEINKIREKIKTGENSADTNTSKSEASGETCEDLREEHRIPSYSGPPGPGYAGRCDDLCVDSSTVIN